MFIYHVEGITTENNSSYKFTNVVSEIKLTKIAAILRAEEELNCKFADAAVCQIG